MPAADDVRVDGTDRSAKSWNSVDLPDDAPRHFVADPPGDLTTPSSGTFTSRAKSPHAGKADAKSPHGGITRTGVVLVDERPPSSEQKAPGRRPVVAVVDTVIAAHPWLGDGVGPDSFWHSGDQQGPPDPWVGPELEHGDLSDPEGPAARTYGHGTFIAGIIRQLAPEARVLSLPVMSDCGRADTRVVLDTLRWLHRRVLRADTDEQPELFVDVVNLSFGWYRGTEDREFPAEEYREVLDDLGDAGVRVVASAGNRSTTTPVYPAAFAREQAVPGGPPTPLVSVGALDPNGEVAPYSNTGDWVLLFAPGTGLVSTVPPMTGVDWSTTPTDTFGVPYPKPQHQARGFARWGGTSFAAAWVSARIAAHLLDPPHGADLERLDAGVVHDRAEKALNATVDDIAAWKKQRDAIA